MNKWSYKKIDEVKAEKPNAISMGPFGSRIKTENFVEYGVPVIRGVNLKEGRFSNKDFVYLTDEKAQELKSSMAFPDDIVFTHRGTLGQVGIIPHSKEFDRYIVSQSQMKLSCNKEVVNPLFVYYFFKSPIGQNELLKHTSSTGVPAISSPSTTLKQIEIPVPPLSVQTQIAEILCSLDDKIEHNQSMYQTLEDIVMTIYKNWFVDFGPFQNEEYEESELGMIPKGWEVSTVGKKVEILGGGTPSTKISEYWDEGDINWYSPTDLTSSNKLFLTNSIRKITEKGLEKSAAKLFPPYSVMMTSRATIGAIAFNRLPAATNQGFIILIPNDAYPRDFLYCWLKYNTELILSLANGTTFLEVSRKNFKTLPILSTEKINDFSIKVRDMFDQIESLILETEYLIQTRDYLLPRLLAGEIEINKLMEQVEEVL